MRQRNTARRRSTSPLVIMISMGFVLALVALVLWPKPKKSKSVAQKTRTAMHSTTPQPTQPRTPSAADAQAPTDANAIKAYSDDVRGPLPLSMRRKLDRDSARFLSALAARMLIWKLDLRRDLRRGDHIRMLYKPIAEQSKFEILAMKYHSLKHQKTFHYYRYKEANRPYGAYYDETGHDIELQLKNTPLPMYDQVTSILKMRRKHKGVDFKAATGTKVYLPYRSRIIRQTWNFRYNGTCLEAEFLAGPRPGTRALFLHLSQIMPVAKPGSVLAAGTVIALVGNTGRSTAPHLHYQLQTRDGGRIFDPFHFHPTYLRRIPASELDTFQQHRQQLEQQLTTLTGQAN